MKDISDNIVKEKIEGLDALEGGIVFGKEDAWEKLQATMDRDGSKRILLKYWLAVAAVLLVMICILPLYYYSAKDIVTKVPNKIEQPVNKTEQTKSYAANVVIPEKLAAPTVPSGIEYKASRVSGKYKNKVQSIGLNASLLPVLEDNTAAVNVTVINDPATITKMKTPMKVVHINEMGAIGMEQSNIPPLVINTPATDIRVKMRVVHVNDLANYTSQKILEEKELKYMQDFAANAPVHGLNDMRNLIFHTSNKIRLNTQN